VIKRDGLQGVLQSRSHLHPLMSVPQQGSQIPLFHRRHPDRGKAIFYQQLQLQPRIPPIMLLLPRLRCPDLRWMTHPARDP
jgi:hypothetical protein